MTRHAEQLGHAHGGRPTVVQLVLNGPGGGESWLVLDRGGSTACRIDPGYEDGLVAMGDNREMHRWLLGWQSLRPVAHDRTA
jgi:hypothetical protein